MPSYGKLATQDDAGAIDQEIKGMAEHVCAVFWGIDRRDAGSQRD